MSNNVCPCKGCVPPKRTPDCHSHCQEYADWKKAHDEEVERLREIQRAEDSYHRCRFGIWKDRSRW